MYLRLGKGVYITELPPIKENAPCGIVSTLR